MPDYRLGGRLVREEPVKIQVTAFAHSIQCWDSPEAYADGSAGPRLDVGSFVATGLAWDPADAEQPDPEAQAVLVGRVEATDTLDNPVGASFVWARVATDVGSFDVVADPELLERPIVPDGVVRGRFWLSGRVREYVERRRPGLSLSVYRG
jgi:hypothetical protein